MNNSVTIDAADAANSEIFRPIQVGTMALDHRLVVSPHGGGGGHLIGPIESFEQHCAHWLSKLDGGMQWLGGAATFVANPLPAKRGNSPNCSDVGG